MHSDYRILKLKSGEELITKIVGQQRGIMIVERPMVFKSTFVVDEFGRRREITVLRDWLAHTNQMKASIPVDHIAIYLEPDNVASELYDLEKEREDTNSTGIPKIGNAEDLNLPSPQFPFPLPSNLPPNLENIDEGKLEEIIDMLSDHMEELKMEPENINEPPPDMIEEEFIVMNMIFPSRIIHDMIERGIIDPTDIMKAKEMLSNEDDNINMKNDGKISDIFTGDEIDREDFGNSWTDWSSDINDYLNNNEDKDNNKES